MQKKKRQPKVNSKSGSHRQEASHCSFCESHSSLVELVTRLEADGIRPETLVRLCSSTEEAVRAFVEAKGGRWPDWLWESDKRNLALVLSSLNDPRFHKAGESTDPLFSPTVLQLISFLRARASSFGVVGPIEWDRNDDTPAFRVRNPRSFVLPISLQGLQEDNPAEEQAVLDATQALVNIGKALASPLGSRPRPRFLEMAEAVASDFLVHNPPPPPAGRTQEALVAARKRARRKLKRIPGDK